MDRKKIRMIAYGGILTGLVLVATMFLQIPNGQGGYVNLGDGVIFASSLILGPFAGVVAALGSVMSDLFLGYAQYAPATLVIKGLMGDWSPESCSADRRRTAISSRLLYF